MAIGAVSAAVLCCLSLMMALVNRAYAEIKTYPNGAVCNEDETRAVCTYPNGVVCRAIGTERDCLFPDGQACKGTVGSGFCTLADGRVCPTKNGGTDCHEPTPTAAQPNAAQAGAAGFIFDGSGLANPANPTQSIRVGERLSPEAIKGRFPGYKVEMTSGEDCDVCGTVSGPAGSIFIDWENNGTTVAAVTSYSAASSDKFGNRVGGSLAAALGVKAALCDYGEKFTCDSPKLRGLFYLVNINDEKCKFKAEDNKPSTIPDCAKIAGFGVNGILAAPPEVAQAGRATIPEDTPELAWSNCQSTDESKRLIGCTSVINAKGFGDLSKLADAFDGRCWAYNVKQQFQQAIEDCKGSINIRPKYSYAYNNLGTAYLGLHNYQEAIKAFNVAIDLKPDFYWSRLNRAKAFVAIGQNERAVEDYRYLLNRDPTNQELTTSLDKLVASAAPESNPQIAGQTSIRMEIEGGVYVVPVRFNDMITLDAIVDSGASDVSIPADVVLTLIRTKTITDKDFLGQKTYVLADGSRVPSRQFLIGSMKVGDKTVKSVVASIASPKGGILLGQSFLNKFKSWSVDNEKHTLNLYTEESSSKPSADIK